MKKLTCAILVACGLLAASMAGAQGGDKMMGHKMQKMQKMSAKMGAKDDQMSVMMMGLSKDEKKIAMDHMKHMTKAEKAVMTKRCSLCMKDKHAGMSMDMKPTPEQKMAHMMSGLTAGEQKTMKHMWSKMTDKQKAVGEKMVINCCMYGMKHGK